MENLNDIYNRFKLTNNNTAQYINDINILIDDGSYSPIELSANLIFNLNDNLNDNLIDNLNDNLIDNLIQINFKLINFFENSYKN